MQLKNPFPPSVRNWFLYTYACMDCGQSDRGLEIHHIVGRSSASALNAIPLCIECHSHCGHSFEEQARYFSKAIHFLALCKEWFPDEDDKKFYTDVVLPHLQGNK